MYLRSPEGHLRTVAGTGDGGGPEVGGLATQQPITPSSIVARADGTEILIVVDKLLTGFDAPSATYLYIDKQMRDHGLFQAICRVNRLDGESKDYGYIIDYKDLFQSLEGAVSDYTSGALDGYDRDDVAGLLENRLDKAREDLDEAREAVKALCEPVAPPQPSRCWRAPSGCWCGLVCCCGPWQRWPIRPTPPVSRSSIRRATSRSARARSRSRAPSR